MSVGKICARDVDVAESGESVQAAAQRMHARNVGTLVVVDKARVPVGIVTDRDLAVRVVGAARDAGQTTIGEVMTTLPRIVQEETPIEEALRVMRAGRFRRLPVVDHAGVLAGLVSVDDILNLLSHEISLIGAILNEESPRILASP
jgi:CBS domain-containing protein